jgi:hypothetical protein
MTDSTEELKKCVADEVKRQMGPLNKSVEEVKNQNAQQSNLLAMQVRKIDDIGSRLRGLWGNGTGPPGYLERARQEDKEWKAEMFQEVNDLRAERLREQGKTQLRREMEENCRETERLEDSHKTHVWTRAHLILLVAASFAGTWLLSLIRPILHVLVDSIVKAMQ